LKPSIMPCKVADFASRQRVLGTVTRIACRSRDFEMGNSASDDQPVKAVAVGDLPNLP
jgi:hypothetical protein